MKQKKLKIKANTIFVYKAPKTNSAPAHDTTTVTGTSGVVI